MSSRYRLIVHRSPAEQLLLATDVARAETFLSRLRGLIGRPALGATEGLWFENCRSVHMLFMQVSIDLIFYAENYTVLYLESDLKPWRVSSYQPRAAGVVELAPGTINRFSLQIGEQLDFQLNSNPN